MAALTQLDTENADRDLSSEVAVLTHTPDASNARRVMAVIKLGDGTKDLDGTGGNFTVRITVGGQNYNGGGETKTIGTQVRVVLYTEEFIVPANDEVVIYVTSPNAGDTDVDTTCDLYELNDVNATALSGDSTAADNAESFFDGTGYAGTNNVIPMVTTTTNLTNAPTNGDLTATMKASVTAAVPTSNAIADQVWDEESSGHNSASTFGKALRQIKEGIISEESSVNDVSATISSFVTNLTETTDDHYVDVSLVFIDGNLVGQSRPIASYDGTTKTITLDEPLTEPPTDGDSFIIKTDHVHPISQIQSGLATSSSIAALNDISVADVLTTQMTEAYAADGTAPTLAQALFLIQQVLTEFGITGTTLTAKKLDGSTTAATFTLDDASNPSSITRAS